MNSVSGTNDPTKSPGLPAGPLTNLQLGAYVLGPLIGSGGMGAVYSAYDPRLKREVAIKVVSPSLAENPDRLQHLKREARAAAALNHPNIVAVHDIGMHDGAPYIVTERVQGETLAEHLKRGHVPLSWALDVAAQIADALAAVHGRGIVHRDLKPGNVMITPEGRVKVLDFGIAKTSLVETTTTTQVTDPQRVMGTPAYMAPERVDGTAPADFRVDLYSLGVMLFEMVTGSRPFRGHELTVLMAGPDGQAAPLASDLEPTVPKDLSTLIARCLSRNPDARPDSAAQVKQELDRIRAVLSGMETVAPGRSIVWSTRALPGIAVGTIIAAVGGMLFYDRSPEPLTAEPPIIAVLPFANVTAQPSDDYLGFGLADALTRSLSRLSSVTVIPRETITQTLQSTSDPAAIARDVGANLLIQGAVERQGNRLLVAASVLRADGSIAWVGNADSESADVVAVERELSERIVSALRVSVSPDERRDIALPATRNQEALDAYWRGVALLERTELAAVDEAIGSFNKAVAFDPQFAVAHAALGYAFVRKYNATREAEWMTRAEEVVRRALAADASRVEVHLALANIYRLTGRNGSAVEELRRVLAEQPTNDEARRRLGAIFESEGRNADALEQFEAAVDQRPTYWLNHDQLGLFFYRSGRYEDAVRAFTRVTELYPDSAQSFQRLGVAYQALGRRAEAQEHFMRAIRLAPDAASYSNLGTLYYAEGRFAEALNAYQQAIRLRPNRALLYRNLGDTYLKLGRRDEAHAAYRDAVRLTEEEMSVNPHDAAVLARLAVYEAKLGLHSHAEEHIQRALVLSPSDPEILFRGAVVHALAGDAQAAIEAVKEAVDRGFSLDFVREDDDLASLRAMPAFQALVAPPR